MTRWAFAIGAVLATVGTTLGVAGVQQSDGRNLATGFVLLLGAGVFAILSLGGRRRALPPDR
jgi:hypothetical protein